MGRGKEVKDRDEKGKKGKGGERKVERRGRGVVKGREEGRSYIRPLKLGDFADACFRVSNNYVL